MTIGEKVQRFEPRMVGFCDRPPEAGMYVSLHGHYVLHSAYAELAADRDLWRSMATFEGKVSASVLDDLHTTQAQLAELRGRVSVMLEKWSADSGKHPGTIESIVMKAICAELSTLATADGATTGEMKCPTP